MDLVRVETLTQVVYSFLSIGWGFIADIDIESERIRMLGSPRFTIWSIARLIGKARRSYALYKLVRRWLLYVNVVLCSYIYRSKKLSRPVVIFQNQRSGNWDKNEQLREMHVRWFPRGQWRRTGIDRIWIGPGNYNIIVIIISSMSFLIIYIFYYFCVVAGICYTWAGREFFINNIQTHGVHVCQRCSELLVYTRRDRRIRSLGARTSI